MHKVVIYTFYSMVMSGCHFKITLKYDLVPWKYFTPTLIYFCLRPCHLTQSVKRYVFPQIYIDLWGIFSAENVLLQVITLTSVALRINKFLCRLHLCNMIFLFYKCCYLFQTQIEYLFAFLHFLFCSCFGIKNGQ